MYNLFFVVSLPNQQQTQKSLFVIISIVFKSLANRTSFLLPPLLSFFLSFFLSLPCVSSSVCYIYFGYRRTNIFDRTKIYVIQPINYYIYLSQLKSKRNIFLGQTFSSARIRLVGSISLYNSACQLLFIFCWWPFVIRMLLMQWRM